MWTDEIKSTEPRTQNTEMIGALVVSHGHLAQELLASAEMIVGEISQIQAVALGWHDDVNDVRKELERRIAEVDSGSGVLILTDMFGGTPSNIAFSFHEPGKVDVVTGANLPMIVRIASQKEGESLAQLACSVRDQGRTSVTRAGDLLAG